jgi:hypothetical protein
MGRGGRNAATSASAAPRRPTRRGPRAELEELVELADTVITQRVNALSGDDDIDPALLVMSAAAEVELIELRGLGEVDPGWAIEVAVPKLLQEIAPCAVALISDAWEPDPLAPDGRREVAIVVGLDDQGIGSASRGLITRFSNGSCQLGEINSAPREMAHGLMQPLIAGLGLNRDSSPGPPND